MGSDNVNKEILEQILEMLSSSNDDDFELGLSILRNQISLLTKDEIIELSDRAFFKMSISGRLKFLEINKILSDNLWKSINDRI